MTTRVRLLLAALLALATAGPAAAAPIVFDFESTPTTPAFSGALTTLTLTQGGLSVTFTREAPVTGFDILDPSVYFGGAFGFGTRTLSPQYLPHPSAFVATFSAPVSAVSLDFGDFGQDDDSLLLQAYAGADATGPLVDADTGFLPANGLNFGSATLSVSGGSIRSVRFIGGGPADNSVFADNLTVNPAGPAAVPEPASLILLGAGGLGLLGSARRRAST